MIIDHPFKPCHHPEWLARGVPLCLNPTGFDGCHVNNCGQPRNRHAQCCDGNDPACPTHGVAASNAQQNERMR